MPNKVGSVSIDAKIDTSALNRGMLRLEMDLEKIKGKMKGFGSDISRADAAAIGLASSLSDVAVGAVNSMVKLASTSPAVAGAVAQMDVEMGKLSRTSGEMLKPAFDLAADGLASLNSFLEENQDEIRGAVEVTTGFITKVGEVWTALTDKPIVENLADFVGDLQKLLEDPLSLKFNIEWGGIGKSLGFGGKDISQATVGDIPGYMSNPASLFIDIFDYLRNNAPKGNDVRNQLLGGSGWY